MVKSAPILWFDFFSEARAENKNISVRFLVQKETLRFAFEIYWPLRSNYGKKANLTVYMNKKTRTLQPLKRKQWKFREKKIVDLELVKTCNELVIELEMSPKMRRIPIQQSDFKSKLPWFFEKLAWTNTFHPISKKGG